MPIPKTIYMCHKELRDIEKYSENWKKLNPEWEIKLYDDALCEKILLEEYSQLHCDIFQFIPDGPIKADFWRVCVINKYGGLYLDADIEPFVPLSEYIEDDDDFVTCISVVYKPEREFFKSCPHWRFNPHFLMCSKNNPILEKCIQTYIELYENKTQYEYWNWSICKHMMTDFEIHSAKSQIIYENGVKYKFIYETTPENCEYGGKIVFNNRYPNYIDHDFR